MGLVASTLYLCVFGFQCAHMLEKYEETLESWWFDVFAKQKDPELQTWLCIEQVMGELCTKSVHVIITNTSSKSNCRD